MNNENMFVYSNYFTYLCSVIKNVITVFIYKIIDMCEICDSVRKQLMIDFIDWDVKSNVKSDKINPCDCGCDDECVEPQKCDCQTNIKTE